MIDETKQDLAIAYLLGQLPLAEASRFEAELQVNAELALWVQELGESTAALALNVPQQMPPPELREKIIAGIHAQSAAAGESRGKVVPFNWLTPALVALAACLVVALGYAIFQNQATQSELANEKSAVANLTQQLDNLSQKIASLRLTTDSQLKQIADLQTQGSLAQMRIATLSAQVHTYQKAGVVVVWDDQKQQGIIKMVNLPKAAAGKDYQLWIVDPKYPNPVNGGILAINNETSTLDSFKPDQLVTSATAFAISVEKTGGVPKAEGPIVFIGQ